MEKKFRNFVYSVDFYKQNENDMRDKAILQTLWMILNSYAGDLSDSFNGISSVNQYIVQFRQRDMTNNPQADMMIWELLNGSMPAQKIIEKVIEDHWEVQVF